MYGHLIQWLSTLANGRLILNEQGANNNSIYRKKCLLECSKALLGNSELKLLTKKHFGLSAKHILRNNIKTHNHTWKSLQL